MTSPDFWCSWIHPCSSLVESKCRNPVVAKAHYPDRFRERNTDYLCTDHLGVLMALARTPTGPKNYTTEFLP